MAAPDFIHTARGQEYYPFYIRNRVSEFQVAMVTAISDWFSERHEEFGDVKGYDVKQIPFGKEITIRCKDGIGFTVTVQLDHAPTITD